MDKIKKVGVCLKFENKNYGSKLQALATVRKFEQIGLNFEIIHYTKRGIWHKIKSLPRFFNIIFLQDFYGQWQKKLSLKKHPEVMTDVKIRNKAFGEYDEKNFNRFQIKCDYFSDLQKKAREYSSVVTCSDQLWSPSGLGTNFYNLMFVPDNINKVSYASSFGVIKIPWFQIGRTRRYLKRIEHISMRENSGAEIVKNLTSRSVPVLMDPVFAFSKQEWEKMVPVEKIYDFPYLFCYFLGGNEWQREVVIKFAKEKGLKIVASIYNNIFVESDKDLADYTPFDVDPDKFLNILRGATYVCTDSFHGTAFSIICEKNFVVFNRYNDSSSASKNTRIDSVCDNLGLNERRAYQDSNIAEIMDKAIEYSKVDEKLSMYRDRIDKYLKESFKV